MNRSSSTRPQVPPVPTWVVITAVTGTVIIALGAFWLSFATLTDLARRSGIAPGRAWAWPVIVDGLIVVATVSVVVLRTHGRAATRYPWVLLFAGAGVSVTGNAVHAVVARDASVSAVIAASVSAVPPLVLLAITHLTVQLTRRTVSEAAEPIPTTPARPAASPTPPGMVPKPETGRHSEAQRLRTAGWSNTEIAAALGVHPSTIGRWLRAGERRYDQGLNGAGPAPNESKLTTPTVTPR
jgi:hypothetical protein